MRVNIRHFYSPLIQIISLDIYLTYRLGSWQLVHEQDIVVRGLTLSGIRPKQIKSRFNFPKEVQLALTKTDKSRISNMRAKILAAMGIQKIEQFDNDSMKQHWDIVMFYDELSVIEELGYKVELEALESVEVESRVAFLVLIHSFQNGVFRGTFLSNFFIPEYVESRVRDHYNRIPVSAFSSPQLVIEELPDNNDSRLNDSGLGSAVFHPSQNMEPSPSQMSHFSGYHSQFSDNSQPFNQSHFK